MEHLISQFDAFVTASKLHLLFLLKLIAVVWLANIANWYLLGSRLNMFGIYPRRLFGLVGIVCSPFLHGNFNHLFFNSLPFLVLANFILLSGYPIFLQVTAIIVLLSGILVWLFGRKALHIGASSLTMGYFSYILVNAVEQGTGVAIVLGFVTLYYFGGMFFDLFPRSVKTSFEGHIFGFAAGIVASIGYSYFPMWFA